MTTRLFASISDVERKSAFNRAARLPAGTKWTDVAQPAAETRQQAPDAPKRTKHGARKAFYDGQWFDSKLEARVWQDLKLWEKAGEIRKLRRQVKFSLFMHGGEHYGVYRADFVYEKHTMQLGFQRVVADAKSPHTRKLQAWQKVKRLMLACHNIGVQELP